MLINFHPKPLQKAKQQKAIWTESAVTESLPLWKFLSAALRRGIKDGASRRFHEDSCCARQTKLQTEPAAWKRFASQWWLADQIYTSRTQAELTSLARLQQGTNDPAAPARKSEDAKACLCGENTNKSSEFVLPSLGLFSCHISKHQNAFVALFITAAILNSWLMATLRDSKWRWQTPTVGAQNKTSREMSSNTETNPQSKLNF